MLVLKVKGKEKQILEPAVNQYKELPDKIKNTPPEFQNQRTRTSSSKRSRPPATVNRFLNEERFLDHTVLSFRNLIKGLDVFLRRMRIHHQENFLMNSRRCTWASSGGLLKRKEIRELINVYFLFYFCSSFLSSFSIF